MAPIPYAQSVPMSNAALAAKIKESDLVTLYWMVTARRAPLLSPALSTAATTMVVEYEISTLSVVDVELA